MVIKMPCWKRRRWAVSDLIKRLKGNGRAAWLKTTYRDTPEGRKTVSDDCNEATGYVLATLNQNLKAELAEYKRDAKRYRWLRDRYTTTQMDGSKHLSIVGKIRAKPGSSIDAVIDAAMPVEIPCE